MNKIQKWLIHKLGGLTYSEYYEKESILIKNNTFDSMRATNYFLMLMRNNYGKNWMDLLYKTIEDHYYYLSRKFHSND